MRVLVSGAGIAGPTLAWFLVKTGAKITIVEKAQTLLPHGQNIDLQGSAFHVIRKMGLEAAIRACNTTEIGTQLIDSNAKPYAIFPVKKGSAASFSSEFEILRADLAKVLYEATKKDANITYLFGTTIETVLSNDDDSVKVKLSNGEVHTFDLLIAADGQWSKIRNQCFPSASVHVENVDMYAVYYTIPRLPTDNNWWNIYVALRSRIVTLRPDPHGTIRAMFSLMPCDEAQRKMWREAARKDRKTQQELLRKEFTDAGWQAQRLLGAMDQAPDFYFHDIQQIKMSSWHSSRVLCLGDAAFAPSPLTGMGTSLAINGAYVLAGELSKLTDGEHPRVAFNAYENTFRSFVEQQQKIPPFVPAIAHPRTAGKRWMLQVFLCILARLASISWLVQFFGDPTNSEDFPLPKYSKLELEISKSILGIDVEKEEEMWKEEEDKI